MERFLALYLILVNLAALFAMGIDKWKAQRGSWRVPEKTLFLLPILGGSLGGIAGMYLFRHKTRHLSFRLGFPAILILQLLAWYFLSRGKPVFFL